MQIIDYGLYLEIIGYDKYHSEAYTYKKYSKSSLSQSIEYKRVSLLHRIKSLGLGKFHCSVIYNGDELFSFQCKGKTVKLSLYPMHHKHYDLHFNNETLLFDVYQYARACNLTDADIVQR